MANLTGPVQVFAGDTSVVDSAATHPVLTRARDTAGNEYIYLKGVASTAAGTVVTFDEAGLTTRAVANAQGRVAVAMAATVANTWGWYCIYGTCSASVLASFADNGKVYLTATDGSVDDTDVAGDAVIGMIGRSAISNGLATMELNYPVVMDLAVD